LGIRSNRDSSRARESRPEDSIRPGNKETVLSRAVKLVFTHDHVCAWTLWEGWGGYDVKKYLEALRDAFRPFEYFTDRANTVAAPSPRCPPDPTLVIGRNPLAVH